MGICRREFGACLLAGMSGRLWALPPRPKLFILVILDQFRPDYLESAASSLSPGGFRRLLEKGTYFPDCRHLASTFPASSIATLATGAWPSQHGIVADKWYDRSIRKPVGASDEALLATTLVAQLTVDPRPRFTASVLSLDQPSGALFAGTTDARLFWMNDDGQFGTLGEVPEWLTPFNSQRPLAGLHDAPWRAVNARADAPALRTLTWNPDRPKEFLALYRSSPFAMEAQFDLLNELITKEKLGQGNTLDLVCLLTGSSGLLGYETGGRSPLMQQMALRIDRQIELLLNNLTKLLGEKGFNFVATAAHGAPPEPEPDMREHMSVKGEALAESVDRSLSAAGFGHVEKYLYPFLYLDTSGFRDPEPLRVAAGRAALEFSAVANFYTAGGACSVQDGWDRGFRNSFHPTRSGDVMLSYHPEFVEDFGTGRGVSYGSLYSYDVRVPLWFYGPQFRQGAILESPVKSIDLAPTLARLIGVPPPSSSMGKVLGEAFAS
ncbi:MAG TPA: alkaline phosphatase family protein [Bryobacteraceae bacterium]|nr:alkaline phosphatase family protein [Bryobacteraceae bacterium]